jgi:hypothetical protein
LVACGQADDGATETVATSSIPDSTVPASTVPASTLPSGLGVGFDALTFESIDLDEIIGQLQPLDDEARAALAFAAEQEVALTGSVDDYDWRLGRHEPDRVLLLGLPREGIDPTMFATAVVYREGDGWRTLAPGVGAIGQCEMNVGADGFGPARVAIDPAHDITAGSTSVALLAEERACANGAPPDDRQVLTTVNETDATIEVLVLVETIPGVATCPSNPAFPVTIQLDRPLGERQLVDASILPGRPLPLDPCAVPVVRLVSAVDEVAADLVYYGDSSLPCSMNADGEAVFDDAFRPARNLVAPGGSLAIAVDQPGDVSVDVRPLDGVGRLADLAPAGDVLTAAADGTYPISLPGVGRYVITVGWWAGERGGQFVAVAEAG